MSLRFKGTGWLVLFVLCAAGSLYGQDLDEKQRASQVDKLLKNVAGGDEFEIEAVPYVPDLIEIVGGENQLNSDLAIRALQRLKSNASPAISVLCTKLEAKEHATRNYAVEALVAIGDESVPVLENVLKASSGRARAAAVTALNRLRQFDLERLKQLSHDDDARVRAAVATALAKSGKPGVSLLVELLNDPEMAVAVVAANSLKVNQTDTPLAVARLIESLKSPHFGWTAANALASYGTDANRAIPILIQGSPYYPRSGYDNTDAILRHFGPPDPRDLNLLIELLSNTDEEKQIFAARSVAALGTQARTAAPHLKTAITETIQRYHQIRKKYASEEDDDAYDDNSGRVSYAVDHLVSAFWFVTKDFEEFDKLRREASLGLGEPVDLEKLDRNLELQAGEIELLRSMLKDARRSLQILALERVADLGDQAKPVLSEVMAHIGGSDSYLSDLAILALISLGPSIAEEATPQVIALKSSDKLSSLEFAEIVFQLGIQSEKCRPLLTLSLVDFNDSTAVASARAILSTSRNPEQDALLLINMVRDGKFRLSEIVEVFRDVNEPFPQSSMNYFITETINNSSQNQESAINAVGDFGPAASSTLLSLRENLKQSREDGEPIGSRLNVLKSICQITEDFSPLKEELQEAVKENDSRKLYYLNETIAKLGSQGNPFVPALLRIVQNWDLDSSAETIQSLQKIGTADAKAALSQLAESKDWEIRSLARKSLRELRYAELRRNMK